MTNPKHTDTSRSGDLVEWLRDEAGFACEKAEAGNLLEAADRIEALEAENERLRARLAHAEDDCEDDCIYCEERRQEIARAALGEK